MIAYKLSKHSIRQVNSSINQVKMNIMDMSVNSQVGTFVMIAIVIPLVLATAVLALIFSVYYLYKVSNSQYLKTKIEVY